MIIKLWRCARPVHYCPYGPNSAVLPRPAIAIGDGTAAKREPSWLHGHTARAAGCRDQHRAVLVTRSSASDTGDSTACPGPLEEWLRSHGGTVNGVELRSVLFPSGSVDRQLRVTCDHPADSLLISVPRMLQLRYDNIEAAAVAVAASDAPIGPADILPAADLPGVTGSSSFGIPAADAAAVMALYDQMPRGSDTGAAAWQFKQALTLLYHLSRGSASPLLPYLAHLPGLAPGVPTPRVAMLMYDDAVDELQYGMIVQDVRNQKYWLRQVSSDVLGRLQPAMPAAQPPNVETEDTPTSAAFGGLSVDSELFSWAVAVAMSRCFGLKRFRTHTCVPLVDMANHVAPYSASNCEIRTTPAGDVEMYTKREVRAGEELTLTYGTHDNHNLLLSYGFTLQPNPNDAFYFDMDLSTVESLVEGLMEDRGSGPLAPWQLDLLQNKLGLPRPSDADGNDSQDGGGDGHVNDNSAIRVYLSAVTPASIATAAGGDVGDGGGMMGVTPTDAAGGAGTTCGASLESTKAVRQPVDPKLLAALRIATLQDEAWYRVLSPMSADQIGGWGNLLARQQEITVMRVLAALVTALYTTFPTTIQQDRQLLSSASLDVAAASAAATLTSATPGQSALSSDNASSGRAAGWPLHPSQSQSAGGDASATAAAEHARDMAEAGRFRLGLKTTLERCLQALVARAKELDALQAVR